MPAESRILRPDEQIQVTELPRSQRGQPKIWEYRLAALIGNPNWVSFVEGPKPAMYATKSNFRGGRLSKPKGHKFECEVVQLDGQEDNMGTLFFRWVGPEEPEIDPRSDPEGFLRQRLAKLEENDAQVPVPAQVVVGPEEDEPEADADQSPEAVLGINSDIVTGLEDL